MSAIDANRYIFRCLDLNGDGTGAHNANIDGSITPKRFYIAPAAGEIFNLTRLNIACAASSFDRADRYGNIVLTTGITISIGNSDGETLDITAQQNITAWPVWGLLAGSDTPTSTGVGADALNVRWTFSKSLDKRLELVGDQGDYFAIDINDNMTALTYHYFMIQGIKSL